MNKKKDLNKIIKERIKYFFIKLDKELNMKEQAIGWSAIFLTFIVLGIIIKFIIIWS